jgi:N-acetylmuramoyl-L-alanine amidase
MDWKQLKFSFLLAIIFWPFVVFATENKILQVHTSQQPESFHVIFEAKQPLHFHSFSLDHPDRFVIDMSQTQISDAYRHLSAGGVVNAIRWAERPHGGLRVVFVLRANNSPHISSFQDSQTGHYHVRLDFFSKKKNSNSLETNSAESNSIPVTNIETEAAPHHTKGLRGIFHRHSSPMNAEPVMSNNESSGPARRDKAIIVVIDPGHGGKDPGASGRRGTNEKNVVLDISKDLRDIINQQAGFRAELTRDNDYYLTLRQRLAIARQDHADLFVAIHADTYNNHEARGATVFALSERGATSEAARWLAARENESELMGGVNLSDQNEVLKSVLLNLSQTATIRASLDVGADLIHSLRTLTVLHHPRVEQAAFVVLKSPDIPSLLVETGFLSNAYEEESLRDPAYRRRLAEAISNGIVEYFRVQPPPGTWLAHKKFGSQMR